MRTYLKREQSISAIVHIEFGVRRYYTFFRSILETVHVVWKPVQSIFDNTA